MYHLLGFSCGQKRCCMLLRIVRDGICVLRGVLWVLRVYGVWITWCLTTSDRTLIICHFSSILMLNSWSRKPFWDLSCRLFNVRALAHQILDLISAITTPNLVNIGKLLLAQIAICVRMGVTFRICGRDFVYNDSLPAGSIWKFPICKSVNLFAW